MKIKNLFENIEDIAYSQPFKESFSKNSFYHGSRKLPHQTGILKFKLREEPTDTFLPIHKQINELSNKKFGLPIRNLMFCYNFPTRSYGQPFEIIPKGDQYRVFVNTQVNDFTMFYDVKWHDVENTLIYFMYDMDIRLEEDSSLYVEVEEALEGLHFRDAESFDEIKNKAFRVLEELVDDKILLKSLQKEFHNILEKYSSVAEDYIKDCIEVTDDSMIKTSYSKNEFMIYAPDNFYMLPHDLEDL